MSKQLSRRTVAAALVALPACWTGVRAQPARERRATPSQTEGPFYPVALPADSDADLLRNGSLEYTRGEPAWVEGVVTDLEGKPLAGAQVEIWQCDHAGHYHHPGDGGRADPKFQGFGRMTLGSDGRYRFHTIRPAPYSGRTPHIHVKVRQGGHELLTTQLYVAGEAGNARDGLWRSLSATQRERLTRPFVAGTQGLQAEFAVVVQA